MNINELEKYLHQKGFKVKGCSSLAINRIETFFGVNLPLAYKEFLHFMGKDGGAFMKGTSAFYDEIFSLREGLIDLLEDSDDSKKLPDNTFVFWSHQGYQYAFFYLNEGDNPPVYFYYENDGRKEFEKKESSFTNFLEKQLVMCGLV
jgi:hypothetical protein